MRGCGFCCLVSRLLATWYWSNQEAIESKAKEKESDRLRTEVYMESLVETGRTNVYSLRDSSDDRFAIFTVASTYHLRTSYMRLSWISTCIFPDILLHEAYSAHAYS